MNQTLKACVYGKGSREQVAFVANLGGMTEEETKFFCHVHDGKSDDWIDQEMGLSRRSHQKIEDQVRSKLLIAVFDCIHFRMNYSED